MYLSKIPFKYQLLSAVFFLFLCSCEMDRELSMLADVSEVLEEDDDVQNVDDSASYRLGNIIYEETFEGSDVLGKYIHRQLAGSHSFKVASSPVLDGKKSGRFELRKGDPVVTSSGIRAQVLFQNTLVDQLKNEGWYSFGVYLPSDDFTPDDDEESLTYWRHDKVHSHISLEIHKDRFKFRIGDELIDLGPVVKDFWHQYVFHIRHSTGSNGFVEVWQNGKKVVSHTGKTSGLSTQPIWKIGVYKHTWEKRSTSTSKRVVYYDNVKIGNRNATYEEMLPSKNKLTDPSSMQLSGPVELNKGLVGYWKMDEGSGKILIDNSGKKNNATIVDPSGVSWVKGKEGSALRIIRPGRWYHCTVPHNTSINLNKAVTISAWIKPQVKANKVIVSKAPDGYELSTTRDGKIEFWINRESNGGKYRLLSMSDYPTDGNTWVHVAGTFDGVSSVIYINGVADYSAGYGPIPIKTNQKPLLLGARATGNGWEGDLDEIRIYDRALSPREIATIVTGSIPDTGNNSSITKPSSPTIPTGPSTEPSLTHDISNGLVGYWTMDEGNGNQLIDHSGNNGHATIRNTDGISWVNGKKNKALRLFGAKHRIASVPHNSIYEPEQNLTIAAWVRPNIVASKMVLAKGWPNGYYLSISTNGKFEFRVNTGKSGTTYRLQSQKSYPRDGKTWIHVAITFNGNKSTMYVDGKPDNSTTYPDTRIIYDKTDLQIGSRDDINRWSGDLDEVRLYNRTLSASEIAELAR